MNMVRQHLWPLNSQVPLEPASEAPVPPAPTTLEPRASEPARELAPTTLGREPRASEPALEPREPLGRRADALPQDLGTPAPLPPYMPDPRRPLVEPKLIALPNHVPIILVRHVHHTEARLLLNHKWKQAMERVGFQAISQKLQELLPPTWVQADWAPTPTVAAVSEVRVITPEAQEQVNQHLCDWLVWYTSIPQEVREQLPPAPGAFHYQKEAQE